MKVMYELSRHVPIVPVVTKADTMTIREASLYRQEVANKIANPMMPGTAAHAQSISLGPHVPPRSLPWPTISADAFDTYVYVLCMEGTSPTLACGCTGRPL